MALPQADASFLGTRELQHVVAVEDGMICLVLPEWSLPNGFNTSSADLLLRLPPGYPDAAPDMWWFSPGLFLADGRALEATQLVETHLGRQWQRWSRHLNPGQWQPGRDNLESYLAIIRNELTKAVTP